MKESVSLLLFACGAAVLVVGAVSSFLAVMVIGAAILGIPVFLPENGKALTTLVKDTETEQRRHVQARWMGDPSPIKNLTYKYLADMIDVDEYTEQMEALPWTPTDSSKELNTEPRKRLRSAHTDSTAGAATSPVASSTREAFSRPYSGVLGPSPLIFAEHIKAGDIKAERITVTEHQHAWMAVSGTNQVICNTCGTRRHWWDVAVSQEPFDAGNSA